MPKQVLNQLNHSALFDAPFLFSFKYQEELFFLRVNKILWFLHLAVPFGEWLLCCCWVNDCSFVPPWWAGPWRTQPSCSACALWWKPRRSHDENIKDCADLDIRKTVKVVMYIFTERLEWYRFGASNTWCQIYNTKITLFTHLNQRAEAIFKACNYSDW